MNTFLAMSLDRADELLAEAKIEYDKALNAKEVNARAVLLTHEVCERLRSVLDRLARRYWETHISNKISEEDNKAALIYFPISTDQNSFDSILGRWRWKSVKSDHDQLYAYLRGLQPWVDNKNKWLADLSSISNKGKHIDLIPQTRQETRQTKVTGPGGGSVSWGPGVTFGSGVRVMGAPINPSNQRIVPTHGVSETIQIWVSFVIEGYGVDAFSFCKHGCESTRRIATEMTDRFGI